MDAVQKGGYPHFMLKEIHEQPQVARELLHMLDGSPEVEAAGREDEERPPPVLHRLRHELPCRLAGSVYFAQTGRARRHPGAGAAVHRRSTRPRSNHEDVGIFVSQSGETKDVLNALEAAEKRGMTCYGLANVIGSTLTKATSFCLPLCCGYEISVPATKTFTNQVVTFLYLAYRLAGRDTHELDRIPDLMEQDPGDGRARRWKRSPRRSTSGTTCTAWATARPTPSPWKAR